MALLIKGKVIVQCCKCQKCKRTDDSFVGIREMTDTEFFVFHDKFQSRDVSHTYCTECFLEVKKELQAIRQAKEAGKDNKN